MHRLLPENSVAGERLCGIFINEFRFHIAMLATPPYDRLDFKLPDFTRIAWVSETARMVWKPRIASISQAWSEIEWRSVSENVRACTLVRCPEAVLLKNAERWIEFELEVEPLQFEGGARRCYQSVVQMPERGRPTIICAVVGRQRNLIAFRDAWKRQDHDKLGSLLGYPACCRKFFKEVWIRQNCVDTTWAMAVNSKAHIKERTVEVSGSRSANILWRWMGVRLVPHLPCSFNCSKTYAFAERLRGVGVNAELAREYEWIDQILDWPVEWSALHGIAEIKTPILKVSTLTDATAGKYIVRHIGSSYPPEGSRGLEFPYKSPPRRAVAESRGYQLGLTNSIETAKAEPDWYHRDNGFSSRIIMERLHQPIVAMAQRAVLWPAGNIIDFGCGNGVLLAKICQNLENPVPFGIDRNLNAIEHAKVIHPHAAGHFLQGDFFEVDEWANKRRFQLGVLMIGRLLEVPPARARGLLLAIGRCCDQLLVYVYPGWSKDSFDTLLKQAGLSPNESDGKGVGLVVNPRSIHASE